MSIRRATHCVFYGCTYGWCDLFPPTKLVTKLLVEDLNQFDQNGCTDRAIKRTKPRNNHYLAGLGRVARVIVCVQYGIMIHDRSFQSTGAEMWKSNSRVHNFKILQSPRIAFLRLKNAIQLYLKLCTQELDFHISAPVD